METDFRSEISASDASVMNMEQYGKYTILEALPNYIDGLRLVHRRILVAMGDTTERVKGSAVIGDTMRDYHPHGDGGIWDAIVRLCQPFNQCQPLLFSEGNIGAYGGGSPAAPRYLDVTSSEFTRDVYLTHTNKKTLVYVPKETGQGLEPAYLIPVIPMALLTGSQGIAIGFRSVLPYLNLNSVCDLVLKYINLRHHTSINANTAYKEYAKYLIPDYPISGLILNEQELLQDYSEGKFDTSLVSCGVMEVHPNKINVHTVPFGQDFSKCVKQPLGQLTKRASFVTANFTEVLDLTTGQMMGDVELPLKRGGDPFTVLDQLKKTIRFTMSRAPIWNFCNHEGKLLCMDPIMLLDAWYQVRIASIVSDLKQTNVDLFNEYRELTALVVIADHTNKVLRIFKEAENKEATIKPLCQAFGLSQYQAKFLSKLQMHQITHQGKAELVAKVEEVKQKINDLQHQFGRVDEIVSEQVLKIKEKYGKKCVRKTEYNRFTCALCVKGSGVIQAKDLTELSSLVSRWDNKDIEILIYPTTKHRKIPYLNGVAYPNIPPQFVSKDYDLQKEFQCDAFCVTPFFAHHTIILNDTEKTAYRVNGTQYIHDPNYRCYAVGDDFTVIERSGKVKTARYTEFSKRNNLLATGVKTDVVYVDDRVDQGEGLALITCNTNDLNLVSMELVRDGSKYNKLLLGKTYFLGLYKLDEPVGFTVPSEILSRCVVKHLYFKSLRPLMTQQKRVQILLNKKTTSNSMVLTPYTKSSLIWTIKEK